MNNCLKCINNIVIRILMVSNLFVSKIIMIILFLNMLTNYYYFILFSLLNSWFQ